MNTVVTTDSITMFGADWCPDCHRVKRIFEQYGIDYEFKDTDNETIKEEMLALTGGSSAIPTIQIGDRTVQNPENADLLDMLGVGRDSIKTHKLVVIGAGPAALSAAIYTTREDIETVLVEKGVIGGLAAITDWVDNYPGFPKGIAGLDLAEGLRQQAERFGTKIELGEVTGINNEGLYKHLETTSGDMYAEAVLIATGSDYKKLGIPGETEFYGRGVHYCATCDGAFYRDKRLVVVGGGNSAVQEAIFLTRFASHIDMLVRSDKMRASDILQKDLAGYRDKITVHFNTATDEITGDNGKVTRVLATNTSTGEHVEFPTDGVFIFIGLLPNTQFLDGSGVELDEQRFIKTDTNLETSMKGIFAAGDVRSGSTMQVASATGEGATAALMVRHYLEDRSKKRHKQTPN